MNRPDDAGSAAPSGGLSSSPRSVAAVLVACACALLCSCSSSRDAEPGVRVNAGASESAAAVDGSPVRGVSLDVLRTVCAGTCGGRRGVVTVFRDAAGKAQRFRMLGYACSDGPTTYYDARGAFIGAVALQPVVVGSPEAAAFAAQHDELTGGLDVRGGEQVGCRDVPGVR